MFKVLDVHKRMKPKQIMEEFKGKWVFLVDLDGPPYGWFDTAIPAIIADKPFEGKETGIYDKLEADYEGNTSVWSFLNDELNVFGFNEVLPNDK